MRIALFNHRKWGIDPAVFDKACKRIQKIFPGLKGDIHIIFVSDAAIQQLNRDHLIRNYPTDVLSFSYNEAGLLGELYISMDTIKRQAREYGQTLVDELNKIFVHGFLHIQGFTHDGARDAQKMHAMEDRILDNLSCQKSSK